MNENPENSNKPMDGMAGESPLPDANRRIISILNDTSEKIRREHNRREVEEELRRSRASLDWVLEQTGVGAWLNELPFGRLDWDNQTRRLFFVSPDSEPTIELFRSRLHPEDREPTRLAGEKAIRDHSLYAIEHRAVNPDTGEVRWIRSIGQAAYAADGRPTHFDGISYDITKRKQAEEALRKSRDELDLRVQERTAELKERAEQLARLSTQLTLAEQRERRRLAVIIHDHLQQILVGVKIRMEVLAQQLDKDHQRDFEQIYNLLIDALKTSRSLSTHMAPYILYERGLAPGLGWLARTMQETYKLNIETQIDPGIVVDREDVKVLLFESARELLFNVIKHAGTSSAGIKMLRDDAGNLRITVSDRGVGFDPEKILKDMGEDNHFGLFGIRERLELIGGRLEIENPDGTGAVFDLIVPMDKMIVSQNPSEMSEITGEQTADALTRTGRRIRVLLADDHVLMRQGLSSLLHRYSDIEVIGEAADGEETVQMARQLHPDVILMDIRMPKMSGMEATRIIHSELPRIRIIGLSMYEDADTSKAMMEAGAVAFMTKTVRSDALVIAILGKYSLPEPA